MNYMARKEEDRGTQQNMYHITSILACYCKEIPE